MIMDKTPFVGLVVFAIGLFLVILSTQIMIGSNYQILAVGMIVIGCILIDYKQIFTKTKGWISIHIFSYDLFNKLKSILFDSVSVWYTVKYKSDRFLF